MPRWLLILLALWPVWAFFIVLLVARWVELQHDAGWDLPSTRPGNLDDARSPR